MKLNKKAPIMVARIVMANTLKMFFKNTLTLSEKPASNMMGGSSTKKMTVRTHFWLSYAS